MRKHPLPSNNANKANNENKETVMSQDKSNGNKGNKGNKGKGGVVKQYKDKYHPDVTQCEIERHSEVSELFQKWTSTTCPSGNERMYDDVMRNIGCLQDSYGNWFKKIGSCDDVMFTSHIDTADSGKPRVVKQRYYTCDKTGDILIKTDGSSILGADCKAGVVAMLYMMKHEVEGLYYFFVEEEIGRLGSEQAVRMWKKLSLPVPKMCVSFDRKAYTSVITHQMSERTASEKFAKSLIDELFKFEIEMKTDDGGSFTDSYSFRKMIPECTNLSVGYHNAHTTEEYQNISFLERLCFALVNVDWKSLVIDRDPTKVEFEDEWLYSRYKGSSDTGTSGFSRWDYQTKSYNNVCNQPVKEPVFLGSNDDLFELEYRLQFERDSSIIEWIEDNADMTFEMLREYADQKGMSVEDFLLSMLYDHMERNKISR